MTTTDQCRTRAGDLMGEERARPVPQKHAKTSDPFTEQQPEPDPVKTTKIWPLRNY